MSSVVKVGELNGLIVNKGITEAQIGELVHYSQTDEIVLKTTHDKDRFPSIEAYFSFPPSGKTVYVLSNENEKLLGIVWFHYMELPDRIFIKPVNKKDFTITFGLRIYGEARGKGFAHEFMRIAFSNFLGSTEHKKLGKKSIWGDAYSWNIPAIKVYKKFGFKQITKPNEDDRIIMVYEATGQ